MYSASNGLLALFENRGLFEVDGGMMLNPRFPAAGILFDTDATVCADVLLASGDVRACCSGCSEGALSVLNAWLRAADVGRDTASSKRRMSSLQ